MQPLFSAIFVISCAAVIVSTLCVSLLADPPRSLWEHLRGAARIMLIAGASFSVARAFNGWAPTQDLVVLQIGIALMCVAQVRRAIDHKVK